jgi:hypothetical protein
VTFEPSALIVFKYDEEDLPEGMSINSLHIAQYDPTTQEWIDLGGNVDAAARTVTAPIEHLSLYALLAEVSPASFELADFSISPPEVLPGETVTASIVVSNQGDLSGDCEVELKLDNDSVETRSIEVAGGDSEVVTFTITSDVAGEHHVSIQNASGTFSIIEPKSPAAFTVSSLQINPDSVNPGETVDISVVVTNTGELAGSYQASLEINDIEVQTKGVTVGGGGSVTVTFGFIPDTYGLFHVDIGGLPGSFEVEPEPPPLVTEAATTPPEVTNFSATLNYDESTHKLVYARIVYQINQAYDSISGTRLVMTVFHDGEFLEQIPLLTLSQLQDDGRTGQLYYVPSAGWKIGEYSFRAELYEGENLIQDTPLEKMTVTPESVTKIISWWTLGAVIGVAMILIIAFLCVVIYRRRDMLKYE